MYKIYVMYKLFFNDRFLGICDDWQYCTARENATSYKVIKKSGIKPIVEAFMQGQHMPELWLCTENMEDTMAEVCSLFRMVEAAGGLVINAQQEWLLIYRHERWDLPKGRREAGETVAETALREVEEECGVHDLILHDFLAHSYHVYMENDSLMLKKTHWYRMSCPGSCVPQPQAEEGIEQACWVPQTSIQHYLPRMYSSIAEVVRSLAG